MHFLGLLSCGCLGQPLGHRASSGRRFSGCPMASPMQPACFSTTWGRAMVGQFARRIPNLHQILHIPRCIRKTFRFVGTLLAQGGRWRRCAGTLAWTTSRVCALSCSAAQQAASPVDAVRHGPSKQRVRGLTVAQVFLLHLRFCNGRNHAGTGIMPTQPFVDKRCDQVAPLEPARCHPGVECTCQGHAVLNHKRQLAHWGVISFGLTALSWHGALKTNLF